MTTPGSWLRKIMNEYSPIIPRLFDENAKSLLGAGLFGLGEEKSGDEKYRNTVLKKTKRNSPRSIGVNRV
jgi:hypothetical protein